MTVAESIHLLLLIRYRFDKIKRYIKVISNLPQSQLFISNITSQEQQQEEIVRPDQQQLEISQLLFKKLNTFVHCWLLITA